MSIDLSQIDEKNKREEICGINFFIVVLNAVIIVVVLGTDMDTARMVC